MRAGFLLPLHNDETLFYNTPQTIYTTKTRMSWPHDKRVQNGRDVNEWIRFG